MNGWHILIRVTSSEKPKTKKEKEKEKKVATVRKYYNFVSVARCPLRVPLRVRGNILCPHVLGMLYV